MSRKANPKVIGVFVIGALVLTLAGVLILGSGKFFTIRPKYVLYFQGSVAGLNAGASVLLQGVKVGQVVSVQAVFDLAKKAIQIPVIIEVNPDAVKVVGGKLAQVGGGKGVELLVERGMRAQLAMQSFITGQLYILFTFPPNVSAKHVQYGGEYPEIPTVPSAIEKITKKLEELPISKLVDTLTNTLEGADRLINSPEIRKTIRTVGETAKELHKMVRNANDKIEQIGTGAQGAVQDTRQLIANLGKKVDLLTASLDNTIQDARKMMKDVNGAIGPIKSELTETLKLAADALKEASKTLKNVQTATSEDSPLRYKLLQTLDKLSGAADSIRNWADYLERHPEALIRGKGD
jgi:paraquat-inducible protein B